MIIIHIITLFYIIVLCSIICAMRRDFLFMWFNTLWLRLCEFCRLCFSPASHSRRITLFSFFENILSDDIYTGLYIKSLLTEIYSTRFPPKSWFTAPKHFESVIYRIRVLPIHDLPHQSTSKSSFNAPNYFNTLIYRDRVIAKSGFSALESSKPWCRNIRFSSTETTLRRISCPVSNVDTYTYRDTCSWSWCVRFLVH